MSTDDDTSTVSRADRRVQDALDDMHLARREFRRALQVNSVTPQIQLQMQQAILDVHDELRPYREDVEEQWDEATPYKGGMDVLPRVMNRQQTQTEVRMSGGVPKRETTTEPVQIPPQRLLAISHDLDDIAAELGFGSDIEQDTPHDDPDLEDVRELAAIRGQEKALESLPDSEE